MNLFKDFVKPSGIIALLLVITLFGCESNNSLRSEKKLSEKIQARWKLVPLSSDDKNEDWIFNEGKVTRIQLDNIKDTVDTGSYFINTTLSSSFMTISGFTSYEMYNGKWTIIDLDDKIMVIVIPYKGGGGLFERDFLKY